MSIAVARAQACEDCGTPRGATRLEAHLPGGGIHPPDPLAYQALCASCHRQRETTDHRKRVLGY
jgi:hypothetical protein